MPWTQTSSPTRIRRKEGKLVAYRVKPSTVIYEGDAVLIDTSSGMVEPVTNTGQNGFLFVGVAAETVTAPASGETHVLVWQSGVFQFACKTANPVVGRRAWIDFNDGGPRTVIVPSPDPSSGRRLTIGRVVSAAGTSDVMVKIDNDINSALAAS